VRQGISTGLKKSGHLPVTSAQRPIHRAVTLALLFILAGCGRRTDPGPVRRIVTLSPSATEAVHAVGATDLLVGVDDYSTYPPAVTELPRVGSFLSPDIKAIVSLEPDLVIVDDVHTDIAAALDEGGIATLTCDMHSLRDVRRSIDQIATRLDRRPAGDAALEAIDAAVDTIAERRPGAGLKILAVIDHEDGGLGNLVGAGSGSWLDELIALSGATNALAASGVRYPRIAPEDILREAPDVIIDASYSADLERPLAPWASLEPVPAVRDGRVHVLKDPYFLAPSPRVTEALAGLEAALARDKQPE
jgi:iron complex transport system substrate-binding protein